MNAVDMLYKKQIMSDVYINVLSYPLFLKKQGSGDKKARVCTNDRPQWKFI